jgi:predicted DNA-binding transcriptional regulator AlpA
MFIERHSRADATFPKPLRLGSHRRWPLSAVIAWEAAQSVEGSPPGSKAKPHAA